jgi:3-hydroxybutyryl-CoA dehydratase
MPSAYEYPLLIERLPHYPMVDAPDQEIDEVPAVHYFDDLSAGMGACVRKTVTGEDIAAFGELSGDKNPLHFDPEYPSPFGGVIAHGLICASLWSGLLGMRCPGEGTLWIEQTIRFLDVVRPGDTVEAEVVVRELLPQGRKSGRVRLDCVVRVVAPGLARKVIEGEALVSVPRRPL